MRAIIGPSARTPEWYALRRDPDNPRFGATDAAGLIGVSTYRTPRHIYESFWADPIEENAAMRSGRHLEPAIQRIWAEENRRLVVNEIPALLDPEAPVFASLDSVAAASGPGVDAVVQWYPASPSIDPTDSVLEIKSSMSPAVAAQLGEEGSDWIPTDWLCQVQQQMHVADLQDAVVAVLMFGRLRTFNVARNDDLIASIVTQATEMRERVLHRDPPPLDFGHAHTPELVRSLRHDVGGGEVVCDDLAVEWWTARAEVGRRIKELEQERSRWTAKFEAWLIERESSAGVLPGGKKVVRREVSRKGYTVEPKTFIELREVKA
jgi:putative phage-type endonuclease